MSKVVFRVFVIFMGYMLYIGKVEDQRDGKLMGVTCTGCVEQSTCFSESLATSLGVSKVLSVVGCVI